jgi:hypothetical protein
MREPEHLNRYSPRFLYELKCRYADGDPAWWSRSLGNALAIHCVEATHTETSRHQVRSHQCQCFFAGDVEISELQIGPLGSSGEATKRPVLGIKALIAERTDSDS